MGVKSDNHVKPNKVKVRLWLSCGLVGVLTICEAKTDDRKNVMLSNSEWTKRQKGLPS